MSGAPVARVLQSKRIVATIPAGQTLDVDTVKLERFRKLTYDFVAFNSSNTQTKGLMIAILNKTSSVDDMVSVRMGNLPLSIGANVSGSDTLLSVTNPNAFDISIEALRFATG